VSVGAGEFEEEGGVRRGVGREPDVTIFAGADADALKRQNLCVSIPSARDVNHQAVRHRAAMKPNPEPFDLSGAAPGRVRHSPPRSNPRVFATRRILY
jgi:hypothetical protein